MKKAFISIYVLIILLVFGLTITFIYKENETNFDTSQALYNKKIAMYEAESFLNILVAEKNIDPSLNNYDILRKFGHQSEIEINKGESDVKNNEGKDTKVIAITAKFKGSIGQAILTYKEDQNKKIQIQYKRVF